MTNKERLPKYIQHTSNGKGYQVNIPLIGEGKNKYVGRFSTVSEAVNGRDAYLEENGHLHKGGSKNPAKGICIRGGKFIASVQFLHKKNHINLHIGTYESLGEAIQARLDFIESLK